MEAGHGDRVAIHFEGEPGDSRAITYAELKDEVSRAANALLELGVRKGDRVAIYMPMIPETAIAMLASARIGAAHSVVFGGFSADALATRIQDADAKVVITADGGYRRGKPSALKPAVDEAVGKVDNVEHVLVVRRTGQEVAWTEGRDVWWDDLVARQSPEHPGGVRGGAPAVHPLHLRYDGKPKGILHTSGGYLTQAAYTHWAVFDLKPETDVYWCTADVGWVTGHSYIVYAAAGQRRDAGDVRGHAGHPAPGPVLGDRAEVQGHDPLHRADRDPDVHEVGRRHPRQVRPVLPCACWARSASPSTPRRGSGTASTSAPTGRRSWTPGGRPRPAR
ncbi:AMP-binding protein [Streptomyces tricolor]|nr:AMP-binding protein [Streptomyces tricolor]